MQSLKKGNKRILFSLLFPKQHTILSVVFLFGVSLRHKKNPRGLRGFLERANSVEYTILHRM